MADLEGFESLPSEWPVLALGDVASLSSGGTPSKQRQDFWEGSIPWASPKDMKTPWLFDTQDHISEEGLADGSRLVPAGTLFIVIRGMILAKGLPVSMAMVPMAFNQDMKAINTNANLDAEYLLHAFSAFKANLLPEIGTSAHGTRRIGTQSIQDFRIPIPPIEEQRTIAAVLRAVQQAKEATEKVIEAARTLKQSLMRHLFTYGPVPFDKADQVELQDTEIGEVPKFWQLLPLHRVSRLISGGTPSKQRPDFWIGTIPWASPKDMKRPRLWDVEDHISQTALDDGSTLAPAGSIFVVIRGMILAKDLPVAKVMVPMAFNQDMKAIVPNEHVDSDFLLYCLNYFKPALTPQIGTSAHGTKRIGTSAITDFLIPVPPLDVQQAIASALLAIDNKTQAEQSRLAGIKELFNSTLQDIMTGKRRISEFDIRLATEGAE